MRASARKCSSRRKPSAASTGARCVSGGTHDESTRSREGAGVTGSPSFTRGTLRGVSGCEPDGALVKVVVWVSGGEDAFETDRLRVEREDCDYTLSTDIH
jgi:hypothetical protein